jgi:plasmid stabilization system protein ParE
MKRYEVVFSEKALADLEASFEWGCDVWGLAAATNWYFKIKDVIDETLTILPLGCPLLPDQEPLKAEARILVIDRYNIIFHVNRDTVTIVHIRGPFT